MNGFETSLLESGNLLRKNINTLFANFGKALALLTALMAVLVTFTDVAFADVRAERFGAEMMLMLTSIYIIYFSMEDAGEKLGMQSEAMQKAKAALAAEKAGIDLSMLDDLRAFCERYTAEELAYRRRALLFSFGLPEEKPEKGPLRLRDRLRYRRAARMRPIRLSPGDLLAEEGHGRSQSAKNPAPHRLPHLLWKLLPTTVCTAVTVSVMLTAKEGLTAGAILSGLLRLSTLPVIAFRGYAEGYRYVSENLADWTNARASLLHSFMLRAEHGS